MTTQPYQLFPPLHDEEYEALKADIAVRGVQVPVEYDDAGAILDGHHRVRACTELGIPEWPRLIRSGLSEGEKRSHVRALNLARRHLSQEERRALIAAQVRETPDRSDRQIAATLGVTHPTVAGVRARLEEAGDVERFTTSLDTLGRVQPRRVVPRTSIFVGSRREAARATEALAVVDADRLGARPLWTPRELRQEVQHASHIARISDMGAMLGEPSALPSGPFQVLLVDPPWRYDFTQTEDRAIENHYPTMSLDEICALPVPEIVADDALLFLWVTPPKSEEAHRVVNAWGFTYRTQMVWVKDKIGMGRYVRQRHELLFIARRGAFTTPLPADRPDSVIEAPRGQHSEKPAIVAELIERMYPTASKVELFSRRPRPGWTAWGLEAAA